MESLSQKQKAFFSLHLALLPIVCCWLLLSQACASAASDFVEFSGSPNPVGSGARALGMGGAFIAVADDATAASWNPAGLIQLETPEVSMVGCGLYRVEDNFLGKHPEGSGTQFAHGEKLNFLSFTYPFRLLEYDSVISLSYQQLYDFTRNWKWSLHFDHSRMDIKNRFEQDGGLYAWSAAYCTQLLPDLSLGFTLNFWEDGIYRNGWREEYSIEYRTPGWPVYRKRRIDELSFSGFNANLGLLWSVTDLLTVGAVFKTPFTADLTDRRLTTDSNDFRLPPGTYHKELDMPMSYGLGIAYQVREQVTLSADIYRIHWQDFIITDPEGSRRSAVNGLPPDKADIDAVTQVRLGGEVLFVKPKCTIPLRTGLFYDPGPAAGSPDAYYGCTFGSGIGIGRFVFDFAYQYRFGQDVTSAVYPGMHFDQDVYEHTIYSSLIVHF